MLIGWTRDVQPIFSFGTILRNNINEIPTLFRNFLTLFRKHIFAGFSSYQKDNLIGKVRGLGLRDPPQNQWVKMDH